MILKELLLILFVFYYNIQINCQDLHNITIEKSTVNSTDNSFDFDDFDEQNKILCKFSENLVKKLNFYKILRFFFQSNQFE